MKDSKNNILFQKTMIQRFCRNFKDQFMKIQNLEFQTGLIEMQMQHIHKEKIQNISQLDSNQHKFNKVFRAFKQECNLLKINAVESFKSVVNLAYYRNKYNTHNILTMFSNYCGALTSLIKFLNTNIVINKDDD
ncbi:unnamed protein product [Paramecium octaurelia]|uniref:Uncharacterized protein n=1 Tax=Paramecium octaurelia TaxID=43137 RepID=A0A8S1VR93_PAROT|nr:unnamed protein product [Paramecium octaurelia]